MKAQEVRKRADLLDGFGQRGDQMGAVEFAGQRIVPRQLHQLLVAGVALIVDADDALRARRPAVGTGEPAAGLLDPEHRLGTSRSARHIRSGRACPRRHARAASCASASERIVSARARSAWKTPRRLASDGRRDIGKHRAGVIAPGDGVGCDVPDEGRLAERGQDGRGFAEVRMSRSPRFRTLPGDSRSARILPVSARTSSRSS